MIRFNRSHIVHYLSQPLEIGRAWQWWRRAGTSPIKVVFVVGAPRSGTTLVQRILDSHPNLRSLPGESDVFSPKSPFDARRFQGLVRDEVYQRAIAASDNIVTFFEQLHRHALPNWDGMVVEKTPQHVKRLRFILDHFPNARVINLWRDGRDCLASARRGGNIPQAVHLPSFARYWRSCVRARLAVGAHARVFDLRYERLVTDAENAVRKMMDFLELPFLLEQLNPINLGDDPRAKEKAFTRLSENISNRTVGGWRDALSPGEQATFLAIAGGELRHLTYQAG